VRAVSFARPLRTLACSLAIAVACAGYSAAVRASTLAVHVSGNRLVAADGSNLQLRGVDFSGAQYECTTNAGKVWDTPADDRALAGMVAWHVNAVRLPLNEDCWLGINGLPLRYTSSVYRAAIHRWVAQLHDHGIYVLLNLHVAAPGTQRSLHEIEMADADHGPTFWTSVANSFRNDPAVVFDLYNEPKHIGWPCWRDGCSSPYRIAGMQSLIDGVRKTGAIQPVVADGITYANNLNRWLQFEPRDPLAQLAAGFHTYHDGLGCGNQACWDAVLVPIAARVPIISGEIGEFDCAQAFVDRFMQWADEHQVSYLAWAWNAYSCSKEPSLLSSLNGTPSPYGLGVHDHLVLFP
jgi:hypothetical protein